MADRVKRTIRLEFDSLAALSWSDRPGGGFSLELQVDNVNTSTTLRVWNGPLGGDGRAPMAAALRECQSVAAELIWRHICDRTPEPDDTPEPGDTPERLTAGADRAFEAVLAEFEGRRGYPDATTLIPADSGSTLPWAIAWMLTRPESAFAIVWPDGSELLAVPRRDRLSRLRQFFRGPVVSEPGFGGFRTRFPGSRAPTGSSEAFKLPLDYRYEVRAATQLRIL